jgi:hypothetical protein
MRIKSKFANVDDLIQSIKLSIDPFVAKMYELFGEQEKQYQRVQRQMEVIVIILFILLFIFFLNHFFPDYFETHIFKNIRTDDGKIPPFISLTFGIFLLIIFTRLILLAIKSNQIIEKFKIEYEQVVVKYIGNLMHQKLKQITDEDMHKNIKDLLKKSELFLEKKGCRTSFNSVFEVSYSDHIIQFGQVSETSSNVGVLFKGYFFTIPIRKKYSGKTILMNKLQTKNMWYIPLFYGSQKVLFFPESKLKPVDLEWNTFEDVFDVYSDHQVNVRTILSPDTMSDLYDWWILSKKSSIRVVFSEQIMYILLQYPHTSISAVDLRKKTIEKNIRDLAIPILYILYLYEDSV